MVIKSATAWLSLPAAQVDLVSLPSHSFTTIVTLSAKLDSSDAEQ